MMNQQMLANYSAATQLAAWRKQTAEMDFRRAERDEMPARIAALEAEVALLKSAILGH
jgi:cell division protein FtsB